MKKRKTVKKTKTTPMTADERKYVDRQMARDAAAPGPKLQPADVLQHLIEGVKRHSDDPGTRDAVTEWFYRTPGIGQIIEMSDANLRIGDHKVAMGYLAGLNQMCLAAVIPGIFSNELSPLPVTTPGGDA